MLWLIFAVFTAAAVLSVLWPLAKAPRGVARREIGLALYKAQLAEIERDEAQRLVAKSGNNLVARLTAMTNDAELVDTGGSLILTYWPSEFSQIRGQLRRTSYADRLTANELLFQFQFSMGAHGAHPF